MLNDRNQVLELANAMPQVVWIADSQGEVRFYNDRLSLFAAIEKLPDGKWNWESILHPDDLSATLEAIRTAIREAAVFEIEHRIRMEDGTYRWHLSRALPQRNESGAVEKWFGSSTDVHSHKLNEEALRRSEEQLRFAVEAADLGTFYFYPQSQELFWSPKTKELIGLAADEEADVDKYWECIHPDDREKNAFLLHEAYHPKKGGKFENEFRIIRFSDNSIRWMRSKGKVNFDEKGNPVRFLGVTQDMTERKMVEEALAFKNAQLSRINKELDNFVYTASHDLKAPINHVEGLLQVLMMELPKEVVTKGEVPLISTKMKQAIERFKKNIANLAEVVKLRNEEGGETFPVGLEEIVKEVLIDIEPMIKESGVQVELALKPCSKVLFSEKNLRSVVYNLLSNGIKYRSTRREPRVEISCKSSGAYQVMIFKDNGTGIEKENVDQLFTMFKRFHPDIEGTGIGLFMVKRMVENAGGYIEVESQAGQGTTFRVYLLGE